ncbi:leucine-rich repeat protein [Clostridium chromiireducens]|uniref:leucine-rich repeat protein n=1 Tax=Clostridium chromiireducens TaxID=225345 RepID=UPI003AF5DB0F
MRKLKSLKLIAGSLVLISSIFILNPTKASAEWKQTSSGEWWYSDNYGGWYIDWEKIDGKYYYFYGENGLMARDTTIDGFYLDSSGAYIPNDSNSIPKRSKWTVFGIDFAIDTVCKYLGNLEEVIIPSEVHGNQIVRIGSNAFNGNINVKKIIVTNGISEIGDQTFANCPNLEDVYIPDSVQVVGKDTFKLSTKVKAHVKSDRVKELLRNADIKDENIIVEK